VLNRQNSQLALWKVESYAERWNFTIDFSIEFLNHVSLCSRKICCFMVEYFALHVHLPLAFDECDGNIVAVAQLGQLKAQA